MSATIVLAIGLAEIESTVDTTTQNQQQINNSNHGPVSHDLLFSNWLLMFLAGNYCHRDIWFTPKTSSTSAPTCIHMWEGVWSLAPAYFVCMREQ